MIKKKYIRRLMVSPGSKVSLKQYDTGWAQDDELKRVGKDAIKERAAEILEANRASLAESQELLWASNLYSILIVLQGMDTSGKDGTIKHVMAGVNPQGCRVTSFKVPTSEETDHNFLWRYTRALPARGEIGIFNRSYYEDVLVVKVHPELLDNQQLPPGKRGDKFWNARYDDINAFERHLVQNGTFIMKFFLHISREEQKKRLLDRLEDKEKYWKFALSDLAERQFWDDYQTAYEMMLSKTSTDTAPWYIIPADYKWIARSLIADIISTKIRSLDLKYPEVAEETLKQLEVAREKLASE
ncbi:MAG: polyphosphate kinase 2 family protein [Methanomicrobiales archaeon]|jgi:PPK2 family polyphosphate:nucleotide phosphotransferase|nr:polyphosphate kinase 2 family protein [Methanoregulaceae archaeon]NLH25048.1 polyphosphate kinase 2 family protein [Methanomicrobiales archaeon]HNB02855.1 polyphosphate kinase 2 family protein [Methanoregulaceae archaeon]HNJ80329.1 polyphosphate kinase 2 family protein [Methanoregulaceae archaeon]HNW80583.1 polyphosphate kinase 2 family protein [Methanoregulaceae archaeon]